VIRWGGDEFLIVARDLSPDLLEALAGRIRTAVARHPFQIGDGQVVRLTCSIGIACYPFLRSRMDVVTWEQVLSIADRALYVAKNSGRNAYVGFLSTETTPTEGLIAAIGSNPGPLVERGELQLVSSCNEVHRLDLLLEVKS
jgi:predicted signal transduction protein with EAL and GGDEF domain